MMKHTVLIASLLFAGPPFAVGAPTCILDIDKIPSKGSTEVWSPLFQACWEKLNNIQGGELEKIVPPNALIKKLEGFKLQAESVMPKDGYAVYAGPATQEFARETAASIKEKFDIDIDISRVPVIPLGKATYGIISRDLKFKKKFYRSHKKALDFQARDGEIHKVDFFGTAGSYSDRYRENVKILHYEPTASSFTLSISTDKEDERIVVYRPDRECSFRSAIGHVKKAMKAPLSGPYGSLKDSSLHEKDVVKIPYITVEADTDFTEQLSGSLHYVGDSLPWHIVRAFQVTRFELFEEGARVRIETGAGGDSLGSPPELLPITPRSFVYDQPFYVFLWRTGADWPYFATWIDGGDSLTIFTK